MQSPYRCHHKDAVCSIISIFISIITTRMNSFEINIVFIAFSRRLSLYDTVFLSENPTTLFDETLTG